MKIALGLDGSDDPARIGEWIDGGADEFFAGYVPPAWSERYGWEISPNRRSFGRDFQYSDPASLAAAVHAIRERGKSIFFTLNAHQYNAEQAHLVRDLLSDLEPLAPDGYIIADPALVLELTEWGIDRPVVLSTGAACFNHEAVRYYCGRANVRRVIVPRKMSLSEMAAMREKLADCDVELEAMVMGERCNFNDELCFCWHSGSGTSFCGGFVDRACTTRPRFPADWKAVVDQIVAVPDPSALLEDGSLLDSFRKRYCTDFPQPEPGDSGVRLDADSGGLDIGLATRYFRNCGLCFIPRLREIGVDALKVITRGQAWGKRRLLALVRTVVDHPDPTPEFCVSLLGSPAFCRKIGSCFYDIRDVPE